MNDEELKLLKSKVMEELEELNFPKPLTKDDIVDTLYLKYIIINEEENVNDIDIPKFIKDINNLLKVDENFFVLDDNYKSYIFNIISNNREQYREYIEEFNEIIVKLNSIERNTSSLASYILFQENLRSADFDGVDDLKITMAFDFLSYKCIKEEKPMNELAIILSTRYFMNAFPEIFTKDSEYLNKTKSCLENIRKNSNEKRLRKAGKKDMAKLALVLK